MVPDKKGRSNSNWHKKTILLATYLDELVEFPSSVVCKRDPAFKQLVRTWSDMLVVDVVSR
jgi:hypothetical protein